jgi:hypothetical protein
MESKLKNSTLVDLTLRTVIKNDISIIIISVVYPYYLSLLLLLLLD